MKNILSYLIAGFLVISLGGCKKFIENEIQTEVDLESFGTTPAETRILLTQAYTTMRGSNNIFGSLFYQRFTTDYNVPPAGTSLAQSNIAKMSYDAGDGEVANAWRDHFDVVSIANLVIEKTTAGIAASANDANNLATWKSLDGEARFLRALMYFKLVRLYRNVPIITTFFKTFDEIYGVANLPGDKMAEQELKVYNFIFDDLTLADAQLPVANDRGRPTKFAAKTLLGKAYVNLGSIIKHRDQNGDGAEYYQKAIEQLAAVMASGRYQLKKYFPDNFIRDKQHLNENEIIFSVEYHELDNSGIRFGQGSGFVFNSSSQAQFGQENGANGSKLATDHGWAAWDYYSPGDMVRRFWTYEQATFEDLNTDGVAGINNNLTVCPNTPNCEVYIISREPYVFARPYWYETINDTRAFRNRPTANDVATASNGRTYFTTIWADASTTANPNVQFVKYRKNPMTQATFTGNNFDGDLPVLRYAEVLLLYAEAANELGGPNAAPAGGITTATAAVNLVRDRARNFVYYPDLTVNTKVMPSNVYAPTLGDIYKREAKVNGNPTGRDNAADTLAKYYNQISAFRGIREVPAAPTIRNFKEFPSTADFVPDFSASLSQMEFRNQLFDERWRELAGEDNLRWYDLSRLGILVERVEAAKTLVNPLTDRSLISTPFGTSVLQVPNSRYEYLPIPLTELQRNSNLYQNAGF